MEARSARRLRHSLLPRLDGASSGSIPLYSDRISALSDDMILLVLSRLGSVPAAACTGLLSRRWRGLWTGLADLLFYSEKSGSIEGALARFSASHAVSSISIRFPINMDTSSLLCAAARLSPAELVFVLTKGCCPRYGGGPRAQILMPCFHRATSIELDVGWLIINPPLAGEFYALKKLSLSGHIIDLNIWLDHCPSMRVFGVTFRDIDPGSLDVVLAMLVSATRMRGIELSLLGVDAVTSWGHTVDAARFSRLLNIVETLSPQKLIFNLDFDRCLKASLPCFHRATSIDMDLHTVCFAPPPVGVFSALERLSLSFSCSIVEIGTLLRHCPCLRILKVAVVADNITIHSASLEDLDVCIKKECNRIDIVAPMLKKLELEVRAGSDKELNVSISVPMVEKVFWQNSYTSPALMFGFLRLEWARLESWENEQTSAAPSRTCPVLGHILH